jgi:hypothetical protein
MREWSLHAGDPLSLTLASDARLGPTDYLDDQIWELKLGAGDPPAVSLNTTYGLRARTVRLFLRFIEGDDIRNDPSEFHRAPEIRQIYPNFLSMAFAPFEGIDVLSEIWVPHSHAIAGRVTITNNANLERKIQSEMVGQLAPTDGQRMAPFEMAAVTLLSGYSGGLSPVLFMTGGAKAGNGPYPSLALTVQMSPGNQRQFTWVQAALGDRDSSFAMARDIASQNWEAAKSRIEMLNAGHVEIFTGDPDWDAAFMLAQKQAAGLLIGPTTNLPRRSFVFTRQPDQGYSLRGDGNDYNHLWNGQTGMDCLYLADILLPFAPEDAKGLVRNFLAVQDEDGSIDWKPGPGGQRSKMLATPILASLAWRIYEQSEDRDFLVETYAGLCRFVQSWFRADHDRDRDGIPEWDNILQAGVDYHPVYSRMQSAAFGVDVRAAEGPALCALLYGELASLERIAGTIEAGGIGIAASMNGKEIIEAPAEERAGKSGDLEDYSDKLRQAVEAAWDESGGCYFDWDRDTHTCTHGELLLEGKGSGNFFLRRSFENPVRLLIQIRTDEAVRRHPLIFAHGKSASSNNRIERIGDDQFRWVPGLGLLTGKHVYSHLQRIVVHGLEPEDQFTIRSVDFNTMDLTLLAPLWAGIPNAERAEKLIEETITFPGMFWREFGLPICPQPEAEMDQQACWSLNLPWNALIGEGLTRYGHRTQAAELITKLMTAVIQSLKKERAFRRSYHAETGLGQGEFNALSGLAPLGLFLDVLGVRLISPRKVGLAGFNPFPWPVTIKYRGMTIMRQKDKTTVIFPDNQTVHVTDPEPRLVSLEVQDHYEEEEV